MGDDDGGKDAGDGTAGDGDDDDDDNGSGGRGNTGKPDGGGGDGGNVDPCANTVACDEASTACDSDTLVKCAKDENGCMVETRTRCDSGDTDFCDAEADKPACAIDPCADLDNLCDTAGKSCDGANLVNCKANADGCLVATTTDCTDDDDNNTCTGEGKDSKCDYDNCRKNNGELKDNVCVEDTTLCADDILVTCEDDGDGCAIATRVDCKTDGDNNYCNSDGATPACDFDPCIGRANPCLEAGVACEGVNVVTCAANGDGCLVETSLDCTVGETVPNTCMDGDPPACEPCVDDTGCEDPTTDGATSCAANTFSTCHDTDGDTCLNRVDVDCGDSFTCDNAEGCEYSGGDACDSDLQAEVLGPNASVSFPDAIAAGEDGDGNDFSGYACPGLIFPFNAAGADVLYALDVGPNSVVTIVMTGVTFTGNSPWMLLLTSCGDVDGGATAESTCTGLSQTALEYANEGDMPVRVYVAVDADGAGSTSEYGLEVDTRPLDCGDGELDGSEECDDGNIFEDDGCTPACELEEGFACTASSPSVCTRRPTEPVCANIMCPALPSDNAGAVCCTPELECGVSFDFTYGAGCLERNQPGELDEDCPDLTSVFGAGLFTMFAGCCTPDDKCGLMVANRGAGCVERTELWRNMADGFGSFLYTGPLLEMNCGE